MGRPEAESGHDICPQRDAARRDSRQRGLAAAGKPYPRVDQAIEMFRDALGELPPDSAVVDGEDEHPDGGRS